MSFNARKVFLVLGTVGGKPVKANIKLNGVAAGDAAGKDAPGGVVNVERSTLYELIDQGVSKRGVIEIEAQQPGLEAYALTFGS